MGIVVNDAQIWSIIGVLAGTLASMVVVMFTLFSRTLKAELGGVRSEIAGLRGEMNARFDAVNYRLDVSDRRAETLERRVEALDGDMRTVLNRMYPAPGDGA